MTGKAGDKGGLPPDVLRIIADEDRLAAITTIGGAVAPGDADFDRITQLASSLFQAPVALVTLLGPDWQSFQSCVGTDLPGTPVGISFCAHSIASNDRVTVVADPLHDPRFADNPLVIGDQHIRFYAGAPIIVRGARVGTVCVLDRVERPAPSAEQRDQLALLADLAASLFEMKEATRTGAIARQALAREETRRAVALSAASMASWVWEISTQELECDETLPPLFGLPPARRLSARRLLQAIDRRDRPVAEERFRETLLGNDDYFGEYRLARFSPARWLAARGRVVERDANGKPLLVVGVNYDISERKAGEERQKLLLRELNHRVKNTLATVQALATQTVRHASEPRQFLEAFSARLQALGLAHGILSDNEWRGIALHELVRLEVKPLDDALRPRVNVTGPDVFLTPDQALGLGLVLHELASNALNFGSLSVAGGRVALSWLLSGTDPDRRLTLRWSETGGPPVEEPTRQGFGSILIRRSLDKVLGSEVKLDFEPGGVEARITLPLSEQHD